MNTEVWIRKLGSFLESEEKARDVSVFITDGRAVRTAGGIDSVIREKQARRTLRLTWPRSALRLACSIRYLTRAVEIDFSENEETSRHRLL